MRAAYMRAVCTYVCIYKNTDWQVFFFYIHCAISPVYVILQCIFLFVLIFIIFIAVVGLVVVVVHGVVCCFNHSLTHSGTRWIEKLHILKNL